MKYQITAPSQLQPVTVKLPSSKSISNRVLILNALAYSPYPIDNLSDSDDTEVMQRVFESNSNHFDIGAAGTSMRFLTAFLSKIVGEWVLTGSERMKQRPIGILVDALRKLGANIEYIEKEGYPPLKITGCALKGGKLELAGNISSQYISAILMIAPAVEGGLTLRLTGDIISKPYIHLTIRLMEDFGVKCIWNGDEIVIPEASYKPVPFQVEGDWSAASYWYELVALSKIPSLTLEGLYPNSYQGDAKVAELFARLGVKTEYHEGKIRLFSTPIQCTQFNYDFSDQPDLAQTFAVTCAALNIPFHFNGLQTLRIKESDRIYALIDELAKFGFVVTTNGSDTLSWDGSKKLVPTHASITVETYKDHRMAMSFAPLSIVYQPVCILDPMVVTKSYPRFWEDMKKAGFQVSEM